MSTEADQRTPSERSTHPKFQRKQPVRVKVKLKSGSVLLGDCHVDFPDGRITDVLNDERSFIPLTQVTMQLDRIVYHVVTLNKSEIELIMEVRAQDPSMLAED
ncbi:MAG: hypothetical protein KC609_09745 [Myxococcales bacterium]|nr:hypothetical protein [Myxococcales bacterium]